MAENIECEVSNILGKHPSIIKICRFINMFGKTESNVLVHGESGTGKELVANAIHAHSNRSNKPFVKVNCAALSETFLERKLFGHKDDAFTSAFKPSKGIFELANGGTILLDEICNMSLSSQAKLLNVLQEGKIVSVESRIAINIYVRIIATTKINLKKAVQQGAFYEELLNHLGMITISIPPLRKRKDDIPFLVKRFIEFENYESKRHIMGVTSETMDVLMDYDWPGNVRELKEAIEHAIIIENTDTIQLHSLPPYIFKGCWDFLSQDIEDLNLKRRLQTFERQLILRSLVRANWVKSRAAQILGIDQRNLGYFIRKHYLLDLKKKSRTSASDS